VSVAEERHAVALPGARLALALHLPAGRGRVPCVVACHGLLATKDSDKYLTLGAELPSAGLALARFDFRGCGESSGTLEETTIGSRIDDLQAVLKQLSFHRRLDGRFGLLGSSLGGFVALHAAAARGDGPPVVTWNAPAHLDDLKEGEGEGPEGLGVALYQELMLGTYAAAPGGVARHLVIQAEADDVVPVEHGSILFARAAEPCDLVLIPGGDHRLSGPLHRQEAIARSLEWFQRFFRISP
jgi:alpha-beta hydrolase superfamily lysophospholipase